MTLGVLASLPNQPVLRPFVLGVVINSVVPIAMQSTNSVNLCVANGKTSLKKARMQSDNVAPPLIFQAILHPWIFTSRVCALMRHNPRRRRENTSLKRHETCKALTQS